MSARVFEAGVAAGRRWAKAQRNRTRLARLRNWWLKARRHRAMDFRDRSAIYSCFLTNRFMVSGPVKGCPQQYCIPMIKAGRLSEGYWGRLKGWPHRGTDRQALFVEGFVRSAVGADKARFDSLLNHVCAIVSGAGMFDPKTRMKIGVKADKLWPELRNGRKQQLSVAR